MRILLLKELSILQIQIIIQMIRNCLLKIIHHSLAAFQKFIKIHIVMPMYKLTEYRKNYSKITRTLRNCYRDEPNTGTVGNINYSIRG